MRLAGKCMKCGGCIELETVHTSRPVKTMTLLRHVWLDLRKLSTSKSVRPKSQKKCARLAERVDKIADELFHIRYVEGK